MNVLLIGGSGSLINNLIIKFSKEGHRVYLLTGTRYTKTPYQKVFERYNFPYDCACLNEIFESIKMDMTIFLGAYDTNYKWEHPESDAVHYSAGAMNILMSYAMKNQGKFVYLSSHEVFSQGMDRDIEETDTPSPIGVKSMVFSQVEEMCESYRHNRNLDIITIRLDHLFSVPEKKSDCRDICTSFCLEAFNNGRVTVNKNHRFSLLYETDAVEYIYRLSCSRVHDSDVYHISSSKEINELDLANDIIAKMGEGIKIRETDGENNRVVLSKKRYDSEFGTSVFCDTDGIITKILATMQKNKRAFWADEEKQKSVFRRLIDKTNWFVKALIPFIENMIAFIPFFLLNNSATDSRFFANLDFLVLYVLLFAIVYGQQQAIFSAVLATVGYCLKEMYTRSGFEVMLDINTYVWIAQLFILGLVVGYMHDQITKLKKESLEEQDFLNGQLGDIKEINSSNVRVKDALENQLVNQNDSVGRIYAITSKLDQYSPEEVLFYAADMLSELVDSRDISIYQVANEFYARLFSATSRKSRAMGNSVRYTAWGEMYETLKERKVYINRKMDKNFPMMANAVYNDNGEMKIIIMIWSLPWERMTLGQANQLVVISALINNAVMRASRYLDALEEKRYLCGTRMLEEKAFNELVVAYQNAEREGLSECVILKIRNFDKYGSREATATALISKMRQADIIGELEQNSLYVLLANTSPEDAATVIERFEAIGVFSDIVEDGVVCLRPDRIA